MSRTGFSLSCPVDRKVVTRPIRLGVASYRLAGRSLRACFRAVAAVPASSPAYGRRAKPGSHAFGVRAGGPDEHRPTEVGQGKMAGCHVSREGAHIRRLNGRGSPSPHQPEARGVSRRECAWRFATGASSRLTPRASCDYPAHSSGSLRPGGFGLSVSWRRRMQASAAMDGAAQPESSERRPGGPQ